MFLLYYGVSIISRSSYDARPIQKDVVRSRRPPSASSFHPFEVRSSTSSHCFTFYPKQHNIRLRVVWNARTARIYTMFSFLPVSAVCLLVLLVPATALASIAATSAVTTTTTGCPWRITLNIGQEPRTSMPSTWAASGCRLPLGIKCDFHKTNENGSNEVVPQQENCRFTGPDGEVVKPIQKGVWSLKNRNLLFSLNFPQELVRRDVVVDAGTEIFCEGLVYSTNDLKKMNEKFYKARDDTWKAGEEVNESNRRKEAPKKWNEDKGEWEKRYGEEPLLSKLGKQINLMNVKRQSEQNNADRPNPKTLSSDSGPFPGVDSDVFIQKTGIIKIKRGWRDSVIGTWSAEPITGKPVSYYN
jgi:hypothetical protein